MNESYTFFITWTVYGTWLPGDCRGWRRFHGGFEEAQPLLADWSREQLRYPVILLSTEHRQVVHEVIKKHCSLRDWTIWAANPRSNHVHCVISVSDCNGATIRDQLKANCTRALRLIDMRFEGRPVWSRGGDWRVIDLDEGLDDVVAYVNDGQ